MPALPSPQGLPAVSPGPAAGCAGQLEGQGEGKVFANTATPWLFPQSYIPPLPKKNQPNFVLPEGAVCFTSANCCWKHQTLAGRDYFFFCRASVTTRCPWRVHAETPAWRLPLLQGDPCRMAPGPSNLGRTAGLWKGGREAQAPPSRPWLRRRPGTLWGERVRQLGPRPRCGLPAEGLQARRGLALSSLRVWLRGEEDGEPRERQRYVTGP